MWLAPLAVLLLLSQTAANVIESTNMTIAEGETVLLPCSFNLRGDYKILWTHNKNVIVFDKHVQSTDPRLELENRYSGEYNLRIRDVLPKDSGEYKCRMHSSPSHVHQIFLRVAEHRSNHEEISKRPSTKQQDCPEGWSKLAEANTCFKMFMSRERSRKSAAKICRKHSAKLVAPSSEQEMNALQIQALKKAKEVSKRRILLWTSGDFRKRAWQMSNGKPLSVGVWYNSRPVSNRSMGRKLALYCSVTRHRCGWVARKGKSRLVAACQRSLTQPGAKLRPKLASVEVKREGIARSRSKRTTLLPLTSSSSSTSFTTSATTTATTTATTSRLMNIAVDFEGNSIRSTPSFDNSDVIVNSNILEVLDLNTTKKPKRKGGKTRKNKNRNKKQREERKERRRNKEMRNP